MSDIDLTEAIPELEQSLIGWQQLGGLSVETEFSSDAQRQIRKQARLFYIKNPIIRRGVSVTADYVWGRGITIRANQPELNQVVQTFLDDIQNQSEFLSPVARLMKEAELQVDGNIYFTLFTHPVTGRVRVSSIPANEIQDIITDPQNRKRNWFYKRLHTVDVWNFADGSKTEVTQTTYYRDWKHSQGKSVQSIGKDLVDQGCVVYHLKSGGFSEWKFGIPEIYPALDWALAYTKFLSNYASLIEALSRFAWNVKTTGGAKAVNAVKAKFNTTISASGELDRNPPPVVGSTLVSGDGGTLDPIRTAGSVTPASEGKPIFLMVAAAFGLPGTFFGDVDQGNFATSKTLDRPTELGFINRQSLWAGVYRDFVNYVQFQAINAPNGPLSNWGEITLNEYGEETLQYSDGFDPAITIEFPNLLERDTESYLRAVISAITLDGKTPLTIFNDQRYLGKLLLGAIGETDIDAVLDHLETSIHDTGSDETVLVQAMKELRVLVESTKHS